MTEPTRALPQLPLAADLRAEIESDRDAASHEQLETLSVALRDAAQNGKSSLFVTALLPAVSVRLLTAGYRIDPSPPAGAPAAPCAASRRSCGSCTPWRPA